MLKQDIILPAGVSKHSAAARELSVAVSVLASVRKHWHRLPRAIMPSFPRGGLLPLTHGIGEAENLKHACWTLLKQKWLQLSIALTSVLTILTTCTLMGTKCHRVHRTASSSVGVTTAAMLVAQSTIGSSEIWWTYALSQLPSFNAVVESTQHRHNRMVFSFSF